MTPRPVARVSGEAVHGQVPGPAHWVEQFGSRSHVETTRSARRRSTASSSRLRPLSWYRAIGAIVGGVLVDGVGASASLIVSGVAAITGAAVLTSLRRQR